MLGWLVGIGSCKLFSSCSTANTSRSVLQSHIS